jgi:glycosyltransferase involved in cell wall biosynthesis
MVHNKYAVISGEEIMVDRIINLLRHNNHEVQAFFKDSAQIGTGFMRKANSFFNGIYSFSARREIVKVLDQFRPDCVQIQNLFPLISPSILSLIKSRGIPIVMRCSNFRLICPNGLFLSHGQLCEKCRGGYEYWCVFKNCENNIFKSVGYALRNCVARKLKLYTENISLYIAQTEFQKKYLIGENIPSEHIVVIPNMSSDTNNPVNNNLGDYIGYVGRISPEKGIDTLINAAIECNHISFKLAGNYGRMPHLSEKKPENLDLVGHIASSSLHAFYNNSRIIVLPSICYEGFPGVLIEAMLHGKPIICSRIGGLSEIVDDRITGLLFEPGNINDLVKKIKYLWARPDVSSKMGHNGREKALREYSANRYYERLMSAYEKVL